MPQEDFPLQGVRAEPGADTEQDRHLQTHSSYKNNLAFTSSHIACPHRIFFKASVLVYVVKFENYQLRCSKKFSPALKSYDFSLCLPGFWTFSPLTGSTLCFNHLCACFCLPKGSSVPSPTNCYEYVGPVSKAAWNRLPGPQTAQI